MSAVRPHIVCSADLAWRGDPSRIVFVGPKQVDHRPVLLAGIAAEIAHKIAIRARRGVSFQELAELEIEQQYPGTLERVLAALEAHGFLTWACES